MDNSSFNATNVTSGRKVFSKIGFTLFTILAVTSVLQIVAAGIMYLEPGGIIGKLISSEYWIWIANFLPLYAFALPVGLLMFGSIPSKAVEKNTLGAKRFLAALVMCFPLMYIGNIIGTLLSMVLSGGTAQNSLLTLTDSNAFIRILVMVIIAPCVEELIFRKMIIDRAAKYGEKTAVLLSALAFGLFHLNLFQFFYAFALGLVFAYVYTRTGKLRYSFALHAIINFFGSILAPWALEFAKLEEMARAAAEAPETILQYLPGILVLCLYAMLLLGLTIAGIVLLAKKKNSAVWLPAAEEFPKGQSASAVFATPGMIVYIVACIILIAFSLFAGYLV